MQRRHMVSSQRVNRVNRSNNCINFKLLNLSAEDHFLSCKVYLEVGNSVGAVAVLRRAGRVLKEAVHGAGEPVALGQRGLGRDVI